MNKTTQSFLLPLLAGALLSGAAAAQFSLVEVGTIDLSSTSTAGNPEYIGSNPSAIAWDGADLYIAGFNNQGVADFAGLVKLTDALGVQSYGTAFGVLATPSLRGYSGLDIQGGALAAAYDSGAADPNGITAWDLSGNMLWAKNGRGGSGIGFDPGFPGGTPALGQGVGWTTFGSGRRALQNSVTGADIWTSADGMIILTSEGTFWRDMDFDDGSGDIWLREGNNVIHGTRNGDNSLSSVAVTVDVPDQDFINGQNIAYVDFGNNDWVIYNDRATTSGTQDFFAIQQAIRPDGTPVTLNWFFTSGSPVPGAGYFDYSWDPASKTLAVLDFSNRLAYVFGVAFDCGGVTLATETVRLGTPPNPNALLPGQTSGPVLGQVWDPTISPFLTGAVIDALGISAAGPINLPSGLGTLLINPPSSGLIFSKTSGVGNFAISLPPQCSLAGAAVQTQGAQIAATGQIQLTNALDLVLGTL